MTTPPEDPRERFRTLPEPVRSEDTVTSLDTDARPLLDDGDARDALLREAGG
ncbi:hypothetical protein ACWKWC_24495 [Geodermatophilus nigrescens]|uniref:Uncharacterized protein n=1 Tax=Geodermatophilus nigrescens TaxID=1070870 RepID=A0A1M5FL75_9ACTN|nr:hypothetical protein [Geodermatophilus nigrescens]SHF92258.1 hypothetical protein SAMN05444351_1292 [Geodermatophilus nigrescens]